MPHAYAAPSRPLPPACRWLLQPDSAHLLWNAGCIAMVYRDQRAACCQSVIQWRQVRHIARCGSMEQGMRWIDRWMEKRGGLPGSASRRIVKHPEWMHAWAATVSSQRRG